MLVALAMGGLGAGAVVPVSESAGALAIPALAVQTFLTVGAIPRREGGIQVGPGLALLGLHHAVVTLPTIAVVLLFGITEPLGFGIFVMAVAPPAALVPTYADIAEVDVPNVLVFCLVGYGLSLVLTPLALFAAAGTTVGIDTIALTVTAGLIAPSILARLAHPWVARVPQRVRRAMVNTTVFLICFGLGGTFAESFGSQSVAALEVALILVMIVARTFGSGWLAARLAPRRLRSEAPFVGFKNVALAAAVGGTLLGSAAALPGLLAFPVEAAYFFALARRSSQAGDDSENTH